MGDNGGTLDWLDAEEYKIMTAKDPADNIPNDYEARPDQAGTMLWLSGATGLGKTSTAKLLQKEEGFIYYEGDCFVFGLNPYVGAAPKGTTAFGTKALSGISKERTDVCRTAVFDGYRKLLDGHNVDDQIWEDFYDLLCKDVLEERAKLGGKWVIAQAVYTRTARDIIRRKMGKDLILVVLETEEKDLQVERLAKRSLGNEEVSEENMENAKKKVQDFLGRHDPVEDDEPNTFKVVVTKDMTAEDVAMMVYGKYTGHDQDFSSG